MNVFKSLMNDRVTLVKKDGKRFEDLPALVQTGLILTDNPEIPIEDGDTFERKLPSGIVEVFVVLDAGFRQKLPGVHAGYQSKVEKSTARAKPPTTQHVVYNLIGPNTRVNIQSKDSSTNILNVEPADLFQNLRTTLGDSISDSELVARLVGHVDRMETAAGTKDFSDRYKEFIGSAAQHITLVGPFLPALTQFLV